MKYQWLALVTALICTPVAAQDAMPPQTDAAPAPVDPEALALAREIVAIGYPEDRRDAFFGGFIDAMVSQMNRANENQLAGAAPEIRDFVMQRQNDLVQKIKAIAAHHIPAMMDGLAAAYADEFNNMELAEIRDFVATPSGQAFIQRSMLLVSNPHYTAATQPYMNEVATAAQRWQQELLDEIQEQAAAEGDPNY